MTRNTMHRGIALAAVLSIGATGSGWAEGFYLKAYGGLSSLSESDISISGVGSDAGVSFGSGAIAGGGVGYAYGGLPVAAELEWTYRTGDSEAGATTGGDFASTSLMVNGVWNLGGSGRLTPYVGAGVGLVTEIDFDVPSGPAAGEYNERGGLAVQAFGGLSYAVTERVSAFGEVRYFDAGSVTLTGPGGATLDADYSTIDLLAGVSFRF